LASLANLKDYESIDKFLTLKIIPEINMDDHKDGFPKKPKFENREFTLNGVFMPSVGIHPYMTEKKEIDNSS